MSEPLLVSLDEAGRQLGMSRRFVQGEIYAGRLASVKLGRSRRVVVQDLMVYVEQLRSDARGELAPLEVVAGKGRRGP